MTIDTVFAIYTLAVALIMAVMIGGFTIIFMELHRLTAKLDTIPGKFDTLPGILAAEFRTQRAEIAAQTSAIANAITATRTVG